MGKSPTSFFTVCLTASDKKRLTALMRRGNVNARVLTRAHILRQLAAGSTSPAVAENLNVCPNTVRNVARRYLHGGIDEALFDQPRPGQPERLNTQQKQRIVAMVCADPPPGCARWTLHLIVEEACKAKIIDTISHETIRRLLQDHDLRPWREKKLVHRPDHTPIS